MLSLRKRNAQTLWSLKPMHVYQLQSATMPILAMHLDVIQIGTENAMANDTPAQSLFQKVERYFSLFILFINGQNMVINAVN